MTHYYPVFILQRSHKTTLSFFASYLRPIKQRMFIKYAILYEDIGEV